MAISADPSDKVEALKKSLKLDFPVLSDPDGKLIQRWGVTAKGSKIAVPATFVIRPGGTVAWRHIGEGPPDRPAVQAILDALEPRKAPGNQKRAGSHTE